ncbi:MAG: hydrogenase subunit MbhD domain-containing protein [Pseudoxanthomonas sp.]|nr:hydrogenase subunit MbhD domain-containing protein [Pseudoxanthomonas sp.]
MMLLAFDLLLAAGLLGLAVLVVAGPTLFVSLVAYTVFGLLMAVAWARLGAPDLALAEAAIGAGLTGAMLMLSYRRLLAIRPERTGQRLVRRSRLALPIALACTVLSAGLFMALAGLPEPQRSAGGDALAATAQSEVGNPVTAVLLLFRGYDTLLELLVLLVAWLGVAMVQAQARPSAPRPPAPVPLLDALLAAVVPGTVLVGGYLLHAGGQAPGGAFQAGAVLAAAGVLMALAGRLQPRARATPVQAGLLVLGLLVFTAAGLWPLAAGQPLLALDGLATVYAVEAAMTVSIALGLCLLFLGAAGLGSK